MENYLIAIPSYKRGHEQLTAEYFSGMGVPKEKLFIFVQTEEDLSQYSEKYSDIATVIYRSATNVAEARNNVLEYFNGMDNVLMLDDDVQYIGVLDGEDIKKLKSRNDVAKHFNRCFEMCEKNSIDLFGIYPIDNAFFMEKSISTKAPVNTVLGFRKGAMLRFDTTFAAKEDIDLCGKILSHKKSILRFNYLCVSAKHRTNEGGCKSVWKSEEHQATVKRLCLKYPAVYAQKKNNPQEVRCKVKDKKVFLQAPEGKK